MVFLGLVLYDVSFVMGSDVMMTVARGFESPMKVLFKKPEGLAMLGIGDIIVPGLLVSMCIRIDFIRGLLLKSLQRKQQLLRSADRDEVVEQLTGQATVTTSTSGQEATSSYYFFASMLGYNLGLIGSVLALSWTRTPQPALLYICPVMVLTYLGAAFLKRETKDMILYDEDVEIAKIEIKTKKSDDR